MRLLLVSVLFVVELITNTSFANDALLRKQDVQEFINTMVKEEGFQRAQLTATLKMATFQPKIIESMEKPYEKKNWDVYSALFLTPERVEKGIEFWQNNQNTLQKAQKKFGVPASIIVAILGVETMYGERQGNYRVLDALTTLAFYYPKRAQFFKKELKEYLLLCREHDVPATTYFGSYAGAIGKPQFMPSSYRFYAIDFTGNGQRDLIHENKDVIASVANYFHKHGWKTNEHVAQPARVKGLAYQKINTNARTAAYDVARLKTAGITPLDAKGKYPKKAGLIELETENGPKFWLTYPNFYVITRYNTSPQYALVVYLLSQKLQHRWQSVHAIPRHMYA